MTDERINVLAKNIVSYSLNVQKGENVLIETHGVDNAVVNALIREVYNAGGHPFYNPIDDRVLREILKGATKEQVELMCKFDLYRMKDMDCYIGIRGGENTLELSDVPPEKTALYSSLYSQPVHHDERVNNTKWVVLRYPTPAMSQLSSMSTDAFEDFYFDVCNLDYKKMDEAMNPLRDLMARTDKVRLVGKGTDISFSIKGIGAVKCSGHRNIPDGEVYSAPVRDSVNGVISYNAPSIENGIKFENVVLTFKNGKITDAKANDTEAVNKLFDTDEGARYVGEFAIGVNPYIIRPMGDILFDEKICGSIHFTPGMAYKETDNGNRSAIHWDLVMIQTPEYGGGEIWFDDVLIRKDGRFVLPELEGLNPENLK